MTSSWMTKAVWRSSTAAPISAAATGRAPPSASCAAITSAGRNRLPPSAAAATASQSSLWAWVATMPLARPWSRSRCSASSVVGAPTSGSRSSRVLRPVGDVLQLLVLLEQPRAEGPGCRGDCRPELRGGDPSPLRDLVGVGSDRPGLAGERGDEDGADLVLHHATRVDGP